MQFHKKSTELKVIEMKKEKNNKIGGYHKLINGMIIMIFKIL